MGTYSTKTARDMPSFLDQDRPAKVKEIYRALKRDHPEMPAEMKARIAARQGKKGKQHQGPPYKGPLTKEALSPKATNLLWSAAAIPALAMIGAAGSKLSKKARKGPEPKTAALKESLDILHAHFGPPMTKHAALNCLYQTQKPELDIEALTPAFCKLAAASKLDPWDMAYAAVKNYPRFEKLASHSDARYRELGKFYLSWADEMVKRAGLISGLLHAPTAIANVAGTAGRALKAGGGAVRGRLSSAKSLAERGILKGEVPTAREAMRKSVQESRGLIAEGGGSLRRGQKMVAQHGPATTAPVTQEPVAQKGWGMGKKLLAGTAGVGALGAGAYAAGGGLSPEPQYQPVY